MSITVTLEDKGCKIPKSFKELPNGTPFTCNGDIEEPMLKVDNKTFIRFYSYGVGVARAGVSKSESDNGRVFTGESICEPLKTGQTIVIRKD